MMAGATVSETELPIPWNALTAKTVLKCEAKVPQTVAMNRIAHERMMMSRRPKMFARGTQIMLLRPTSKMLT